MPEIVVREEDRLAVGTARGWSNAGKAVSGDVVVVWILCDKVRVRFNAANVTRRPGHAVVVDVRPENSVARPFRVAEITEIAVNTRFERRRVDKDIGNFQLAIECQVRTQVDGLAE